MNAPDMQDDLLPDGVELTDWNDFDKKRTHIFDAVRGAFEKKFPVVHNGVRMELADVHYVDPENYSAKMQKEALMGDKFLHRRLRGTYVLKDDKTGEQLDSRTATLMRVPYLTERGTFLHGGSEYTTINQARLLPGVYSRRKENGDIESHFNARRGSGHSFRVRLEPQTGLYKLDIGQSSLRLYSLLRDIGVPDMDIEKRWGPDLLRVNQEGYDPRVFEKAYSRLVRRPDLNADRPTKMQAIKDALAATKLDRAVVEKTLPNAVNRKSASVLPSAAEQPARDDFDRPEYVLLAKVLNDKMQAGIDMTESTPELVEEILAELKSLAGNVNSDVLAMAVDQMRRG